MVSGDDKPQAERAPGLATEAWQELTRGQRGRWACPRRSQQTSPWHVVGLQTQPLVKAAAAAAGGAVTRQRTRHSWSPRPARLGWRRPPSPAMAGGRPRRPEGVPGAASGAAASWPRLRGSGRGRAGRTGAGPGWTHRGSRRLRGPHMKAPGDGPLLGRGVPTRTAGARGRKPGARRGLLGAGRVPWRAEPASPSRSASSPPRPCTQRWRPQSCGGHRGAVRPVPGEAPPLRPCPSVTRAGAGNSSAGRRGQRIIPGRSAPAWWAGA